MKKITRFENINNKRIFCVLSEPSNNKKKIVIINHGFRGNSVGSSRAFVNFERLLFKENFSVLRFDQPCSGNSQGQYIDSSFNEWIETTSYFTDKYLKLGYQVVLMGQSMGATTAMVVAGKDRFKDRIPCIILWVPDAKTNVDVDPDKIYEEKGQKYRGKFWIEARDSNFFDAMNNYPGGIHLVYGEDDEYVSKELRKKTIEKVKSKGQSYMVLEGQGHVYWEFDVAQKVYREEISFLSEYVK